MPQAPMTGSVTMPNQSLLPAEPVLSMQGLSFYDTPSASVLQTPQATSFPPGTTPQWQPPPTSRPAQSRFRHPTSAPEANGPETDPPGRSGDGNGAGGAMPPSMNGGLGNHGASAGRHGMGGLQDGGSMQQSASAADQVRWHSTAGPPGPHLPSQAPRPEPDSFF